MKCWDVILKTKYEFLIFFDFLICPFLPLQKFRKIYVVHFSVQNPKKTLRALNEKIRAKFKNRKKSFTRYTCEECVA